VAPENAHQEPDGGEDVPALLRRVMDERRWTQSDLARAIGVLVGTVNTWVNGKRTPTGENLRKLAAGTGISEATWVAATGRKIPAELDADREARLIALWRSFTPEEQRYAEGSLEGIAKARAESHN
jgi:transcriptional regulator with XRE-family HTH domain